MTGERQPGVGRRGKHAFFVEPHRDLAAARPRQRHGENAAHDEGRILVNDNPVLFRRVHPVAVHGLAPDELPLALLVMLHRLDLLGDVLGVHVVHDGPKRGDVIRRRFYARIHPVQQRDVAHALFREVPLHVVAGHDVIAAQTGKVLGDDHVDLARLDVPQHPLKTGSVEAGAAPAIIDVGIIDVQTMLADEGMEQGLLVGHAAGRPFVLILLRQSDIQCHMVILGIAYLQIHIRPPETNGHSSARLYRGWRLGGKDVAEIKPEGFLEQLSKTLFGLGIFAANDRHRFRFHTHHLHG